MEPTYGLTVGDTPGLLRSAQDPLALLRFCTHGQAHMPMCRDADKDMDTITTHTARHKSDAVPTA